MKRIISIFFLVIFLFNVGGYYLVFWCMEVQATKNLLTRLDAESYNDDEAIVLTIPLTMPYPIHSEGYQRVDGDFLFGGEHYKLVKQKVENDTLFIVCIRDAESTKLAAAFSEYAKATNSLPVGSKQAMIFLGKLHKDFNTTEFRLHFASRVLFEQSYFAEATPALLGRCGPVESPPPRNKV